MVYERFDLHIFKFGFLFLAVIIGFYSASPPPPPPIWAHIGGRYWSAKIDDISV